MKEQLIDSLGALQQHQHQLVTAEPANIRTQGLAPN
jgi:hypothetical protein